MKKTKNKNFVTANKTREAYKKNPADTVFFTLIYIVSAVKWTRTEMPESRESTQSPVVCSKCMNGESLVNS